MAKRKRSVERRPKGKPKQYKRETNAQRAAREYKRRTALQMADYAAELIRSRRQHKEDLAPEDIDGLDISFLAEEELESVGWLSPTGSKYWWKVYAFLGQVFCEFHEDPAQFFRLVADSLQAERPLSASNIWYDRRITEAYKAAAVSSELSLPFSIQSSIPRGVPENKFSLVPYFYAIPTFSEFSDIFRKQNPNLKIEDNSLRRSLRRLGYDTRPEKRGRKPKRK
jgi:hypothetical protein